MQLLLGLFFFSILLSTGSSLQCENCIAIDGDCSAVNQECGGDACMSLVLESKATKKNKITLKQCYNQTECQKYEKLKEKDFPDKIPGIGTIITGAVIKDVTCSKAPPSFASFFPAFLGLLLMKLLF